MPDTYSDMIKKAEADGLVMNDIKVIVDVTYVGNTSGAEQAREEVGHNTYAVDPVLCFFDIDVSDSPSGIDGYRYCFGEKEGDDNRQNDCEGNRSDGYWYINHSGEKNDSKRVNAQVPINLSYDNGKYNPRTFNLYIRDRVGNVSVTKLGNQWMMDNTYPVAADGASWNGGKAIPGNSYLSLPGSSKVTEINVTIAGSSQAFKDANENGNAYTIKIPADWFGDYQVRNGTFIGGTGSGSGLYGAGLIPNVKGSAKPIVDGNLTVDIPYFIYKDANATTAKPLEYYIFDNTGNYWDCHLNVKVDASAPTMRVGVTRLNDSSTFHTKDNLYTKVYGTGAVPTGKTPDTTATADDRLVYQGNALETFTPDKGYSKNEYENLYSLASNVSKQYSSKADVDYAVGLSSCTAALHLCVKLAGEKLYGKPAISHGALEGKRVFCSDMTFDATLNPVVYEGGIPVFIDTEEDSWNMDPVALRKAFELYPDVQLVVSAELYGFPGRMDEMKKI